jgi:hypothetical protein
MNFTCSDPQRKTSILISLALLYRDYFKSIIVIAAFFHRVSLLLSFNRLTIRRIIPEDSDDA